MAEREHLVVGGGITGLVCAYSLLRQGESVLLLEASDRFGGWGRTERSPEGLREWLSLIHI